MLRGTILSRLLEATLMMGCIASGVAGADTVAVIGTGRVCGALGPQFARVVLVAAWLRSQPN